MLSLKFPNILIYCLIFLLCSCNVTIPYSGASIKNYKAEEVYPFISNDLIGRASVKDLKKIFAYNYILDFHKKGGQIWKVKVDHQYLILTFNQKEILDSITYPDNFPAKHLHIKKEDKYFSPDVKIVPPKKKPKRNIRCDNRAC